MYEVLLGGKKGTLLTLSAFSKLSKAFSGVDRTRIELVFKSIVKSGNMDLDNFFIALEHLAQSELN